VFKLEDFNRIKQIGAGAFGKVFLVQNSINGELYALKMVRKDMLIDTKQIESAFREKEIMKSC
jgi:serine/threonine protein kinase